MTNRSTRPPRVALGGLGYNDDEEFFDFQYEFDCFDVVALRDLHPGFLFDPDQSYGLGSMSGHLRLVGLTATLMTGSGTNMFSSVQNFGVCA